MTPVFDSSLLLIEPLSAAEYQVKKDAAREVPHQTSGEPGVDEIDIDRTPRGGDDKTPIPKPVPYKKRFYGRVDLNPPRAKADFATIVDEIVLHLINSPTVNANIKIEIEADCLEGFDEATQRTIKENCNTLKFDLSEFE